MWLHLQFCSQVKACNPEPIEMHLRSLDPKNGVAWIGPLGQRSDAKEPAQVRATLIAVANSERFDVYWNAIVLHTVNAIVKTRMMDSPTALVAALGMAAAQVLPAYPQLTNACKGQSLEQADTVVACRRVSEVLRGGDTYLSEFVGIVIAKRVAGGKLRIPRCRGVAANGTLSNG
jgi:hypothetical protein